jgi:glycosyltransferase involved in cell wall biosynthesis
VEPLVGEAWAESTRPVVPPLHSASTVAQVHALRGCQAEAGHRRARVLIVASDPRWGGGRRAEGHLVHALLGRVDPADVVVIYTDQGGRAPRGRFPRGVREVDLAGRVADVQEDLVAMRVLVELVRSFHADVVVNVNSLLLHKAMATYGRGLHASERIFPMMFGNEQLAAGNWVGLPLRYFYRTFDLVAGVLTDSHHLADWLAERHQLTPEQAARIHVLSAPVDPDIPVAATPDPTPGRRPRVYWAGRFDRQKKVGLVFDVARLLPDVDFHLWGEPVLNRSGADDPPANVVLHGAYGHLSELELGQADAWLYTSGWDGVPGQLLEVAMTGVPLVASLVGGTGEVVGSGGARPVTALDDPDEYAAALRDVLADPDTARAEALSLRERLVRERTPQRYAEQAARVLLPDADESQEGR